MPRTHPEYLRIYYRSPIWRDRVARYYSRHQRRCAFKAWEQACRQRWRALALAIKAKLEAVEAEITSFEDEYRRVDFPAI